MAYWNFYLSGEWKFTVFPRLLLVIDIVVGLKHNGLPCTYAWQVARLRRTASIVYTEPNNPGEAEP